MEIANIANMPVQVGHAVLIHTDYKLRGSVNLASRYITTDAKVEIKLSIGGFNKTLIYQVANDFFGLSDINSHFFIADIGFFGHLYYSDKKSLEDVHVCAQFRMHARREGLPRLSNEDIMALHLLINQLTPNIKNSGVETDVENFMYTVQEHGQSYNTDKFWTQLHNNDTVIAMKPLYRIK